MGLSARLFLLDGEDRLYRLPNAAFARMLREPQSVRLARFAGQRARLADLVIELHARQPVRVVRATYGLLGFDEEGRFEARAFDRQQAALADAALAGLLPRPAPAATVIEAASRFLVQGARWSPARALQRRIEAAALGRIGCPRP